jgi:hypothetical protein
VLLCLFPTLIFIAQAGTVHYAIYEEKSLLDAFLAIVKEFMGQDGIAGFYKDVANAPTDFAGYTMFGFLPVLNNAGLFGKIYSVAIYAIPVAMVLTVIFAIVALFSGKAAPKMVRAIAFVNLFVYGKNGSKTASTDATASGKREGSVLCAFVSADTENGLESVVYLACALNVARSTKTYGDVVFSLGSKRELCIEGGYSVNLFERNVHSLCDHVLNLDGKIAVDALSFLHNSHKTALVVLVVSYDFHKLCFLFLGSVERDSGKFLKQFFVLLVF